MLKEIRIVHQANGAVYHPKEGMYLADDERGEIWSVSRNRWMRGQNVRGGYLQVCLQCEEGKHPFSVHRLIYETFCGSIPQGLEVNHIDENKEENRLSNLNLMTHGDNNNHGTRNARAAAAQRNDPNKSKQVHQYDLDGNLINTFHSTQEAQREGFNSGKVSQCCRGKLKTHKGFIWSYEPI